MRMVFVYRDRKPLTIYQETSHATEFHHHDIYNDKSYRHSDTDSCREGFDVISSLLLRNVVLLIIVRELVVQKPFVTAAVYRSYLPSESFCRRLGDLTHSE